MLLRLATKVLTSRVGCLAGGAAFMYLYDPDRGRSRRAQLQARAEAGVRRKLRAATHRLESQERYLAGRLEGSIATARGAGRYRPESDVDLREHLRQVIHSMHIQGEEVNLDVNEGIVAIRGQIGSEGDRERVLDAVRAVEGVSRIEDYMHLPGSVAPNKAAVIGIR